MRIAALVAAAGLLILAPAASGESARPAVIKTAEWMHEVEHLEGGTVSVSGCHRGKHRATVVCAAALSGVTVHEGESVEARCSVTIGAIWHPVVIEGVRIKGGSGYWSAQPVTLTECEGAPVTS